MIRAAWEGGQQIRVFATETRPYLQGARLTAWEFRRLGIPVTLITDSMVGHLFQTGGVGAVVVGTDRTAASGDVANKIGTYQIAVLARRHGIPFYVAAPTPSIDLECAEGSDIPIEERSPREVTHIGGRRVAAEGVEVFNPAFDVTPAELVTGIITEHGVVRGAQRWLAITSRCVGTTHRVVSSLDPARGWLLSCYGRHSPARDCFAAVNLGSSMPVRVDGWLPLKRSRRPELDGQTAPP